MRLACDGRIGPDPEGVEVWLHAFSFPRRIAELAREAEEWDSPACWSPIART
jgi:hypothetical protein